MILNKYFKNILEIYKLYWIEKTCFYEIDRNNKIYKRKYKYYIQIIKMIFKSNRFL